MRIGLSVPQLGVLADPDTITTVAAGAEAAGYDSLWVMDRLLAPLEPRDPYPGTLDGALPAEQRRVLDPLVALTFAAATTSSVRLGTNVLVAPWYPAVPLARALTTLDIVSRGRLTVGLGIGWSTDEYEATGSSLAARGPRLDHTLDVLHRVWTDDIVQYDGSMARIAPCTIEPKPHQRPHPPVLLAAFTPSGFDRVARRADGWLPAGMPPEVVGSIWVGILQAAEDLGRDPRALQLVVRANIKVTSLPLGSERTPFTGTIHQIARDVRATQESGADELILDVQADARTGEEVLDLTAHITDTAGVCTRTVALA
jgi:probable F420-dependent oxidoreductase